MDRKKSSKSNAKTAGTNSSGKKDFLVVGLGASAGGVKALQEFFGTMPPNSGMAFVVILHLSPEHESGLGEIIQSQTTMNVTVVNATEKVEPNRVYVIPPNKNLEMVDGVIRSTETAPERGARVAIDVFFRTLADAYRKNAVCVVLSGTGTDGTLGLKAVKEANGFAIVQDPADAEYDSMPRSALETLLVDWVLPVRKMPEKLIQFRHSSEKLHLTTDDDQRVATEIQADDSLREILTILRVRTGHDFSNYKTPTLVRRIARHLQIHDLEDIPAYLDFLREKPDEIHSLVKNLLINVTNFFRDKEAWAALEKEVVPKLFEAKKSDETVRVWSCGCASGEEAYSLAMILSEYANGLPDPPKFQIFATDVDEDAINEAREHLYPLSIETDVSPARLRRFFVKEGKHYRVKKELREMILFAPHNVLRDPPFSKLDLIACRNLLIYLNRDTQERLMEVFHFALNSRGHLFLGSSETADGRYNFFSPVDRKFRIYTRRSVRAAQQFLTPRMPVAGRWEVPAPELIPKPLGRGSANDELHYKLLESFAPPSVLVNQDFEIQYLSEPAGRFLTFRGGEPSNKLLKLVNTDLLPDLRAALFNVQREGKSVEFRNVRTRVGDAETSVTLIVRPFEIDGETTDFLLVIFDENNKLILPVENKRKKPARRLTKEEEAEAVVERLENELARTRETLRSTIEQHEVSVEELKASNEELQAINEELRSTTEELETSKEELQSVNEELTTVNNEHKEKIEETTRTYSDLQNLMASTEIATIFLDRMFRIKRITPSVEKLFNISPLDVGRPLEHFTHKLDYKNLSADAAEVLENLTRLEREIRDNQNRTYLARLAPYRTLDDRIEGVVVSFLDITDRKQAEEVVARELKNTQLLHELAALTPAGIDNPTLYERILETAIEITRADAGTIQLYDEKTRALLLVAAKNFPVAMTRHFARVNAASKTSCGIALAAGARIFIDFDAKTGKNPPKSHEMHLAVGLLSAQSTPFLSRSGKPLGMFTTHWREHRRPTENEMRFLDLLAHQAADLIEQRQADEKLRESEMRLQKAISIETVGIIFFDSEGRIKDANDAFLKMSGYTRADLRSGRLRLDNLTPPEFMEATLKSRGELLTRGQNTPYEKQVIRPDGSRWWGLFAGQRLGENEWVDFVVNITERKNAEVSIINSENRMRIAIEAAELATWEWDLKSDKIFWNERHFKILGIRPRRNPLTPDIFFRRIHPDDRRRVSRELEKAIAKKGVFNTEFCIIRKDGATRWMSGYGRVTAEDSAGRPVKMSGVMFDITGRKEAEEALRKNEEQLKLILESTRDYAIITYDLKGTITRWNAGAEKIFGYTEKEARGKTTHLIFTPEDRATFEPEKELAATLKNGRAEDERWHIRKDGSRFFASGVMQLLRDGAIEGFVKICRDQTARLEAEQSALEKQMLRRLVAAQEDERRRIARDIHDHFGQQITALRLKLDAIGKASGDNAELNELTAEAQSAAAALDADVDFIAWELRPAALDDLGLRAALAQFVGEWSNHTGIPAEFHASGLGKTRLAFEVETNLYRIAQEALNNVQKHAKAENVSVLLEKNRNQVSLIIEDDGVGFNPNDKANRQKGLGLIGMTERAKICGGDLEIESGKSKGTTVFARVPAKK